LLQPVDDFGHQGAVQQGSGSGVAVDVEPAQVAEELGSADSARPRRGFDQKGVGALAGGRHRGEHARGTRASH
jgi:hypothetical protein